MPESKPREIDIAMLRAIKTLIEVMLANGDAQPDGLAKLFEIQRDSYRAEHMPQAAVVMEVLRRFSADPERARSREEWRMILEDPPAGTA